MTFAAFKRLVDAEVSRHCGLASDCLPDIDFWNYFDSDLSADEAAEAAKECAHDLLAEEGFPFDDE